MQYLYIGLITNLLNLGYPIYWIEKPEWNEYSYPTGVGDIEIGDDLYTANQCTKEIQYIDIGAIIYWYINGRYSVYSESRYILTNNYKCERKSVCCYDFTSKSLNRL